MEGLKDIKVNTTDTATAKPATSESTPRTYNNNNSDRPSYQRRPRSFKKRKKVCRFCDEQLTVDYKNVRSLKYYVTERGKILPSRISGTCAKHQRRLSAAVKRARILALLPFSSIHDLRRK